LKNDIVRYIGRAYAEAERRKGKGYFMSYEIIFQKTKERYELVLSELKNGNIDKINGFVDFIMRSSVSSALTFSGISSDWSSEDFYVFSIMEGTYRMKIFALLETQ
jgi:hypothetical protein